MRAEGTGFERYAIVLYGLLYFTGTVVKSVFAAVYGT